MDEEILVKLINELKDEADNFKGGVIRNNPILLAKTHHVFRIVAKVLPEHITFFRTLWNSGQRGTLTGLDPDDVIKACEYAMELLELEKSIKAKTTEGKIFQSAKEKLAEAGKSFMKEDWPSTMNNLNTCLELMLKEKLNIPTTIPKINTAKIIEILIKHNVGPTNFLNESKKRISEIDNKIKHQGYNPSKIDCINAIKSAEELFSKLDNDQIVLTEEIKNKVYSDV